MNVARPSRAPRRVTAVLAVLAVLAALPACRSRETGSIDLLPSASPSGMTMPPPLNACAVDEDCPGDPKHRVCRATQGDCVECLENADCNDAKKRCDDKANCVPCEGTECGDAAAPLQR